VPLGRRVGRMTHDLRDDAPRHLDPLGEAGKGSAKAMQGHMLKAGDGQRAIVDVYKRQFYCWRVARACASAAAFALVGPSSFSASTVLGIAPL